MISLEKITEAIAQYQPITINETPISSAVMLILLATEMDEIELVLTKRASTLATYAGHYSFPGGMKDTSDHDLYATVVREVSEELNLSPNLYQYIGQLDDFHDRYNNLVRPFVTTMSKMDFEKYHRESIDEIAEIYYFSLSKLDQLKDDPHLHALTRRRPSYTFTDGDVFVWGLTATILIHFENIIFNLNKPLGKLIS